MAIEEIPISTSEVSKFTRSELLERFPEYDFHSPESKENLHAILRNEKILAEKEARLVDLKRKVAEQEAAKELLHYVDRTVIYLHTEYPDLYAFHDHIPTHRWKISLESIPMKPNGMLFSRVGLQRVKSLGKWQIAC